MTWPAVAEPGSVADVALVARQEESNVLDAVEEFLARFVSYPSEHARVAHVLWCAHAHRMDSWESTPRLAFLSPEPGSGKSRALEVTELLVPAPLFTVNVSPAALFRSIGGESGPPTLLYDEIDTVFGARAKEHEDVRGLLNAGHRRGATTLRCVNTGKGNEQAVEAFPAYCAVALAGLGDLPDTIMTRSVVIRMRRRAPGETVEQFRPRLHRHEGEELRERLEEWTRESADLLDDAWPDLPHSIEDRNADVWEPLLTVADAAGGTWPQRARAAAVALVAQAAEKPATLGIRLLADLRAVFDERRLEAISTDSLLHDLCAMEEAPWGELRGKELDSRGLARMLRKYDVAPKVIRVGDSTPRGYRREDLHDAWSRYLPPAALSPDSATSATPQQDDVEVEDPPSLYADEWAS